MSLMLLSYYADVFWHKRCSDVSKQIYPRPPTLLYSRHHRQKLVYSSRCALCKSQPEYSLTAEPRDKVREVLHFSRSNHRSVTKMVMFSVFCWMHKIFYFNYNTLKRCLFYRQMREVHQNQQKRPHVSILSPALSTGFVERFTLAKSLIRLQPKQRIVFYRHA